jgi:dipeptidyl aminopeptidase/acylaminoacyl peptidase
MRREKGDRFIFFRKNRSVPFFVFTAILGVAVQAAEPLRLITTDDVMALHEVADPRISPDGNAVAYTVTSADAAGDEWRTHVWMTDWAGNRAFQVTRSDAGEDRPRWSPDGKYLSFLSARPDPDGPEQLWLLERSGGEAVQLTEFKGSVTDYEWSPDGRRLALIVEDEDPDKQPEEDEDESTRPPIVISRFYFKQDEAGYLRSLRRHLYVYDVLARKAELLTPGDFDESLPSWSPGGSEIGFVSKRTGDPDRNDTFGIYAIAPRAGSMPRLVTTFQGETGETSWMTAPVWSPDGRQMAFVAAGDPKLIYYSTHHLMLVPSGGGPPRNLTPALDRNVTQPRWSPDGRSLYMLVEDDRNQDLARLTLSSGRIETVTRGRHVTAAYDVGGRGRVALLDSRTDYPGEIHALESRRLRQLTRHNDSWRAGVRLAGTEEISFEAGDGTAINGFMVKPPDHVPGRRYPTLLWLHGGPVSQFDNAFWLTWQILAAQGYAIVGVNPRGSSGRGQAFATAILADWGNRDVADVLAAVDYAVARGVSDPGRLGVGGWSYGGILTNYVIASDTRFKAAVSGASASNILAGYGTDMYIREYEAELGVPWRNTETWLRLSYPFLHAERITTPTLFLCGERDFNVPLLNSEQMYQALRSLGVDTQLVIYPGQFHALTKPSYERDRIERYLAWYGKYLK